MNGEGLEEIQMPRTERAWWAELLTSFPDGVKLSLIQPGEDALDPDSVVTDAWVYPDLYDGEMRLFYEDYYDFQRTNLIVPFRYYAVPSVVTATLRVVEQLGGFRWAMSSNVGPLVAEATADRRLLWSGAINRSL